MNIEQSEKANSPILNGPEVSIIIPTFNERENVDELLTRIHDVLKGVNWEAIFVDDDSPDGTASYVRDIAQNDHRVRCIQRIGRRGLSTAVIEGALACSAPFFAVIDGDLQHDESLLLPMLTALKSDEIDIVIGSRYISGGGVGDWDRSRVNISHFANKLSNFVTKSTLSDAMSGFFMMRREAFMNCVRNLSGIGFKILLDLFASSPHPLKFKELAYEFKSRQSGDSKFDTHIAWDYGMLLLDKLVGKYIPVRFIAFSIVGGLGVFVHLLVVTLLFKVMEMEFITSQIIATLVAMTGNFILNNILTYHDVRLTGWGWLKGWLSFSLACGIGAFANVGIATYLFSKNETIWILAALSGILVGAVWNYAITMVYTWQKTKPA